MVVTQVREQLKQQLKTAMKARQTVEIDTLRTLLGAIDNAEAVAVPDGPQAPLMLGQAEVARRELSHPEIMSILQREHDECTRALAEYARLDLPAEVARLSTVERCIDACMATVAALDPR